MQNYMFAYISILNQLNLNKGIFREQTFKE